MDDKLPSGRHKTKVVESIYIGNKAKIDIKLATLIKLMWDAGIDTQCCCQSAGNDGSRAPLGYCWILFRSCQDYLRFMNIVAVYEPKYTEDSMYAKICGTGRNKDKWYTVNSLNNKGIGGYWKRVGKGVGNSHQTWTETDCSENDFDLQIHLRFPPKHIPYLEQKLREAL